MRRSLITATLIVGAGLASAYLFAPPVAVTGTATPATLASCTEEDGSTAGQAFPCVWDAATHGNGQGSSYTLVEPATCAYARTAGPVEGC